MQPPSPPPCWCLMFFIRINGKHLLIETEDSAGKGEFSYSFSSFELFPRLTSRLNGIISFLLLKGLIGFLSTQKASKSSGITVLCEWVVHFVRCEVVTVLLWFVRKRSVIECVRGSGENHCPTSALRVVFFYFESSSSKNSEYRVE